MSAIRIGVVYVATTNATIVPQKQKSKKFTAKRLHDSCQCDSPLKYRQNP